MNESQLLLPNFPLSALKGRGALSNPENRFHPCHSEVEGDGWSEPEIYQDVSVQKDYAKSIIATNRSPDVPFNQSINAYQGCEHGCIYCYARPTHAYWDKSPGLDFETQLFYKPNAPELLEEALSKPGYRCQPIAMGTNTDPYQPLEARKRITRQLLEICLRYRQPVTLVTKSALILDDMDLLAAMAEHNLVSVMVSLTTLDKDLKRIMEPRAAAPAARLAVIHSLREVSVPVGLLLAPLIPALNDHELEDIIESAVECGVGSANYQLLRLPLEVADLFSEWLETHFPERKHKVLQILSECHGGRLYDTRFAGRMGGRGEYARLYAQRFASVCRRLGVDEAGPRLDCEKFTLPTTHNTQLALFTL